MFGGADGADAAAAAAAAAALAADAAGKTAAGPDGAADGEGEEALATLPLAFCLAEQMEQMQMQQQQEQQRQQQGQEEQEEKKQEANSQPLAGGLMLLAIGRHNAAVAAERLLPLSNEWKVVELGHSPAPPAAARDSRQRPLRVGPYSRALITATTPPASIRLRRMAGWRRRVAQLGRAFAKGKAAAPSAPASAPAAAAASAPAAAAASASAAAAATAAAAAALHLP